MYTFVLHNTDIVERTASVVDLLAMSLPQQSLFFTIFIVVSGLGRLPFKLLRMGDLVQFLARYFITERPKTKQQVSTVKSVIYIYIYSLLIIIIIIPRA